MKIVIILIILFFLCFYVNAKVELIIPKMVVGPDINGVISKGEWDNALKLDKFYQVIFEDNTEPTEKTELYFGYDDENIYLLGKCFMKNQDDITVYHCERDRIARTDRIIIFFDTFLSNDKAYVIGTNILGGKEDAIYTNNGFDMSIDIPFSSKGNLTNYGYVLEIAIPLKSLKYKSGKNVKWGAYVRREILVNSKNEHEILSPFPISKDASTRFDDYAIFEFNDLPTNRNLKLIPSFITSYSENVNKITNKKNTKRNLSPELNVFYEPNSYLNSTITLNPDFNIIEADAINIEVNNRYPAFYQEKRPFFIEQTNPFETPINVYHTRNIVEPIGGVKIGGSINKYSFYSLAALDEDTPGERFFENYEGEKSNTLFCFSSFSRQLKCDGSTIRTSVAVRKFDEYYNTVYSIDSNLRFWKYFTWKNQIIKTENESLGDEIQKGSGYSETFIFDNENWDIALVTAGISPEFRADLGYSPEMGAFTYFGEIEYSYYPREKSIFWKITAEMEGWEKFNYEENGDFELEHGNLFEQGIEPKINIYFKNKIDLNFKAEKVKIRYGTNDKFFDTHSISNSIWLDLHTSIGGNCWFKKGKSLWHDWNDPVVENFISYGSWIYYRPNKYIDVNLSISYQMLNTFYNAQSYELRVKYQFNDSFWIRGIFQVYDEESKISYEKFRFINFYPLFSYQPDANISLYLGATGTEDEGEDKMSYTKILDSRSISYFFKISYAFDIM